VKIDRTLPDRATSGMTPGFTKPREKRSRTSTEARIVFDKVVGASNTSTFPADILGVRSSGMGSGSPDPRAISHCDYVARVRQIVKVIVSAVGAAAMHGSAGFCPLI
jgi:hypothetical protein